MGVPFPVGEQPDEQAWYDAHAAAWEAEVRELQARIEALERLEKTANEAGLFWRRWDKARIETLERALKDIRAYATNPIMETARTGFSIIEKTANAALRGEERG